MPELLILSSAASDGSVRETVRLTKRFRGGTWPTSPHRRVLASRVIDASPEPTPGQHPSRYRVVCGSKGKSHLDRPVSAARLTVLAADAVARGARDVSLG